MHTARFTADYRERYELELSVDGQSWERCVEAVEEPPIANADGYVHDFPVREARYVRLVSRGNNTFPGGHVARIVELQVFGPAFPSGDSD